VVGDPLAHIDPNGDGDFKDSDGLFEYAPCHNHFHYKHYATSRVIRESNYTDNVTVLQIMLP